MERLTGRNEAGQAYYKKCFEEQCSGMGEKDCALCDYQNDTVCERLAAYEDLGVSPEQLHEFSGIFREECEEVNRLEKELAEYKQFGYTPKELELCFNPRKTIYVIEDGVIILLHMVAGEEINFIAGEVYWNARDCDGDCYEIPLAGLGKEYWLNEFAAQEALERLESE